jgi:hypothetical protein
MPPYPLFCYSGECGRPALYKIAVRWSDGVTQELKTYALCCAECLPHWFERSLQKHAACRLAPGETLEKPAIFTLQRGRRDSEIERLPQLEAQLRNQGSGVSGQESEARNVHSADRRRPNPHFGTRKKL